MSVDRRVRLGLIVVQAIFVCFALGCGLLIVALGVFYWISGPLPAQQLKYSELIQQIDKSNVSRASIDTSKDHVDVSGILKLPEKRFSIPLDSTQVEEVRKHLAQAGTPTSVAEKVEPGSISAYAAIGGMLLFLVAFFMLMGWQLKRTWKEFRMLRSQESK